MKNSKIPKIRFDGFTDDWEQREFGEVAEYKKGPFGSAITKDMFVAKSGSSVKVYEQQNAINKNEKLERYFIPKEYANKLNAFEVKGGDIIVSCAGTIGEMYELPLNSEVGIINQALMRVRVNEDIINKTLFQYLFSNMIDEFSKTHSNGSAIKNIPPFADLKPTILLVPSNEEQELLVKVLSCFDNLIACHQRKYDKLVGVKKSMLEKMFPKNGEKTPEIRFDGFTDDWEQRELGEMTDCTIDNRGKTPQLSEDGIPLIEIASVGNYDVDYSKVTKWISEETFDNSLRNYLNHGDILFSTVGTTALCSSYNTCVKGAVAQNIIGLRYSRFNSNFMMFMLTEPRNNNHIKSIQMNGVQGSIKVPQLLKLEFKVAKDIKEQTKIGSFFATLDNLITCHQRELTKLKNIKKSMLEKMFI